MNNLGVSSQWNQKKEKVTMEKLFEAYDYDETARLVNASKGRLDNARVESIRDVFFYEAYNEMLSEAPVVAKRAISGDVKAVQSYVNLFVKQKSSKFLENVVGDTRGEYTASDVYLWLTAYAIGEFTIAPPQNTRERVIRDAITAVLLSGTYSKFKLHTACHNFNSLSAFTSAINEYTSRTARQ